MLPVLPATTAGMSREGWINLVARGRGDCGHVNRLEAGPLNERTKRTSGYVQA